MTASTRQWADQLVRELVAKTTDIPLLQGWFDVCRSRLIALNAARRGIPLEVGCDVYANGKLYVITGVEHGYHRELLNMGTLANPDAAVAGPVVETVTLKLRRNKQ